MKTLKKRFEEIIDIYYDPDWDTLDIEHCVKELLEAVRQRDAFIIGEDEKEDSRHSKINDGRRWHNVLKNEQRNRAKQSLE